MKNKTTMIIGIIAVAGIVGVVATTLSKKDKLKLSKPRSFSVVKNY